MNDQELYEYIANYLNGLLSEKEQKAFQQRLKEDASFSREYELHRDLQRQLIKHEEITPLKETIKEVIEQSKSKKQNRRLYLVLLIVVGVIAGAWYFLTRKQQTVNVENVFAMYYEKYPSYPILRNSQDTNIFKQGILAYAEGDYSKAIQIFDSANTNNIQDVAPFYLAMSYLENAQYDRAKEQLTSMVNQGNSEFTEAILWYQALLLLRNKELDLAKPLLEKLQTSRGKYAMLSKEILNQWPSLELEISN